MASLVTKQKQIKGWVMFDWANSAYNLVIVSTVFPAIFKTFVPDGSVFLGFSFPSSDSLYTYAICVSYLIISLITPVLSGIADYGGYKKKYMQFFSTLGAIACASLFFFDKEHIWIGIVGAIIASVGFSGSLVFYNGFLSELVPKRLHDKISAKGFAYGYLGSSLLLIFLILLNTFKELFGVAPDDGVTIFRFGFILVGLWWFSWARWTFSVLPSSTKGKVDKKGILKKGFKELKSVWDQIKEMPRLKRFLVSFFIIDLGVQTIVIIAPLFSIKVFKMGSAELVVIVLIMQFLGIAGASVFSKVSKKYGNVTGMIGPTITYLLVCVLACVANEEAKWMIYLIAALIGFAMGGIQSLFRSTYSKLLPETDDHASFFSFFDIVEKVAILTGTFIYAGIDLLASKLNWDFGERLGVATLGVFFLVGLVLLRKLKNFKSLDPFEERI
ncbi:MAG: UMF1 family MFS transporter [Flavobacteriales bacterium]|jgi:UMF1 family MFS transporter|tara:strand:- start:1072 stop:2400 length:1329 start_codon:yes stop_codon:yes gene_type:complete